MAADAADLGLGEHGVGGQSGGEGVPRGVERGERAAHGLGLAGVCEYLARGGRRGGEELRHSIGQGVQPLARARAEAHHGVKACELRRVQRPGQVALVYDADGPLRRACGGKRLGVRVRERLRAVENRYGQLRALGGGKGPAHALTLGLVRGLAQSRRVRQAQQHPAEQGLFLNRVPRRARLGRDYRPVVAEYRVQKRALARVRAAHYRRAHALAHYPPALKAREQFAQLRRPRVQARGVVCKLKGLDVLVRVVQHGVEVRYYVNHIRVHLLGPAAERAAELAGGVDGGLGCGGLDDVDDGLGLGEVEPAVQKGALGELARPGLPGPGGEERLERGAQHDGGAVALQFGGVLAGVAVRRAADGAQAEVEHAPGSVHKAAVDELAVPVLGHGPAVGGAEHGLGGGDRPGAGDADDAYGGDDLARGDGGYGV